MNVGSIGVHDVLLVARAPVAGALENEPLAVRAEVGFGVLTAIRELPDVGEMTLLARIRRDGVRDERSLSQRKGGNPEE
jgi:hypothetical protein